MVVRRRSNIPREAVVNSHQTSATTAAPVLTKKSDFSPRPVGITHLASPPYALGSAAAVAKRSLSSTAHRRESPHASNAPRRTLSLPRARRSRSPWEQDRRGKCLHNRNVSSPFPSTSRTPELLVTSEDGTMDFSLPQRAERVCRRLEHTIRQAECLLMRAASPARSAATCACGAAHGGVEDVICISTTELLMDALQRYRSGCMAALLELEAIRQQELCIAPLGPPSPVRAQGDHTGTSTARDSTFDAAQLQLRYYEMETRLSQVLAAQSAYIDEVRLQQQQRERDGVMGEFMWTAKLLVEREASEREHITSLWGYLVSPSRLPGRCAAPPALHRVYGEETERAQPVESKVAPLPPRPMLGTSVTTCPSRDVAGDGGSSSPLTMVTPPLRPPKAARSVVPAQESVPPRHTRSASETSNWEKRLRAAQDEAAQWKQRVTALQANLDTTTAAHREKQQCCGLTFDGLHRQLKDTTKKMWQLHLANDYLDAKARVLERERDELRLSLSPLQTSAQQGDRAAATSPDMVNSSTVQVPTGDTPCVVRALLPPSGGVRDRSLETSRGNDRDSPRGGTRQHEWPLRSEEGHLYRGGGRRSGSWSEGVCDIRFGQPYVKSCVDAENTASEGRGRGDAQAVRPGVWIGYEERSHLAHLATPTPKGPPTPLAVSSSPTASAAVPVALTAPSPMRWVQPEPSRLVPRHNVPLTPTTLVSEGSKTSAGPPTASPLGNRETILTSKGNNDDASRPGCLFERTRSPIPPLSLERTPAPAPTDSSLTQRRSPITANDAVLYPGYLNEEGEGAAAVEGAPPFLPPLPPSRSTTADPRARLEAVRRDILHHAELLEEEVQAVTAQHEATRRQRRRNRDTLRVNARLRSASGSPSASEPREEQAGDRISRGDDGSVHLEDNDAGSEALNRTLEEMHVAQQEDDDGLEQYYANVNEKRAKLENWLRAVNEKLATLA